MRTTSTMVMLITLLCCSCGNRQQHTDYPAALAQYIPADRSAHPFFDQEEFEWSLVTPDGVPLFVLEDPVFLLPDLPHRELARTNWRSRIFQRRD